MNVGTILVTAAATALASAAVVRIYLGSVRSARSTNMRLEASTLATALRNRIDCKRTLNIPDDAVNPNVNCETLPPLILRDRRGNELGSAIADADGWFQLDGNWNFRPICEGSPGQIRIEAESRLEDPARGGRIVVNSVLGSPVCSQYFRNDSCKADEVQIGYVNNEMACVRQNMLVDFSTFESFQARGGQPMETVDLNGYAMCRISSIQISYVHSHGEHSHSSWCETHVDEDGNESCIAHAAPVRSIGGNNGWQQSDCQILQLGPRFWQLAAGARIGADMACDVQCWKYLNESP